MAALVAAFHGGPMALGHRLTSKLLRIDQERAAESGAGGIMTTWAGGPAEPGGRIIAAGDRRVHDAALAMLAG